MKTGTEGSEEEVEDPEVETAEEEETEEQEGQEGKEKGNAFDTWLAKQDDDTKGLIEDHTHGLTTALTTERTQRKELEKKLKKLGKSLKEGSDERKQVETLTTELKETNAKTAFYEAAHKAGVTNLKLAWLAVQADDLVDDEGDVDFEALEESHPQLFASKTKTPPTKAHAGEGNGKSKPQGMDMNKMIRRASGRR